MKNYPLNVKCVKSDLVKKESTLLRKDTSSLNEINSNEAGRAKLKSFDLDALKKPSVKNETGKMLSSKSEYLNIAQNSENKLETLNVFIDKLESDLSVLALKEQVLTKMAKLVSLDAMELADSLQINISQGNEFKDVNDPTDSINLFLN